MSNEMMTCEVCGKQKTRSEMSKSYPRRCKECVAAHTKEVRRAAKNEMRSQNSENIAKSGNLCSQNGENRSQWVKATVKSTGETVMVKATDKPVNVSMAFYEMENGRKFMPFHLQFEKEIDWEQRRYEIAKDMLAAIETNSDPRMYQGNPAEQSKWAIMFADALIAELKKGSEQL